jgi:nanoRNase/pAp phosphatase (c-di-AMP/oligoRNAs hydrolase)
VKRICFFHAGCPDGFGAAWSVWRAWGDDARYVARGHEDELHVSLCEDALVVFVDIAPPNAALPAIADVAERIVVLDHHVTARARFENDVAVQSALADGGHTIHFDLDHSGAVLAWQYFHTDEAPPPILQYVEDQDLWNWKLPRTEEVNAALASYDRDFETWNALAARSIDEIADEGVSIVRTQAREVERALYDVHPIALGTQRIEGINATYQRAPIGHELAKRSYYGKPWGIVYRMRGDRVDATLYSIGDLDVATIAESYGGGGHRNAAGFSVPLRTWLDDFVV